MFFSYKQFLMEKWKETERWISAVGKCWQAAGCLQPWLVVKKNELKRMQELEIRGKKVRRFSLGTMTNSNQTTPVWSSCFKARWQKSCKEESSEPELQIAFRKARFFLLFSSVINTAMNACRSLSKTSVSDMSFAGERKAISPKCYHFSFFRSSIL